MKIYNGWKLRFESTPEEYTIYGSLKIRGAQKYLLVRQNGDKSCIERNLLLKLISSREAQIL
jgi:hypothetical protein